MNLVDKKFHKRFAFNTEIGIFHDRKLHTVFKIIYISIVKLNAVLPKLLTTKNLWYLSLYVAASVDIDYPTLVCTN